MSVAKRTFTAEELYEFVLDYPFGSEEDKMDFLEDLGVLVGPGHETRKGFAYIVHKDVNRWNGAVQSLDEIRYHYPDFTFDVEDPLNDGWDDPEIQRPTIVWVTGPFSHNESLYFQYTAEKHRVTVVVPERY